MGYWQKNILQWILAQITLDSRFFAKQETPPIVFMGAQLERNHNPPSRWLPIEICTKWQNGSTVYYRKEDCMGTTQDLPKREVLGSGFSWFLPQRLKISFDNWWDQTSYLTISKGIPFDPPIDFKPQSTELLLKIRRSIAWEKRTIGWITWQAAGTIKPDRR